MTPIDDELRTALHRRAAAVAPPADPLSGVERRAARIRRRRMASAVAGTALAVVTAAVAVPLGFNTLRDAAGTARGYAGGGPAMPSPPTGMPTGPTETPPPPNLPANFLDWPARGQSPSSGFESSIVEKWAASHAVKPAESVVIRLWTTRLPEGGEAGIWQLWRLGPAHTVVGQRLADGQTFIIRDTVTPRGARAVSSILQGGAFPHVVVLGPPATGQIRYAADGRRFAPAERLQGFAGGDGWAVFDRTGPAIDQKLPDPIEILDGNGRRIFRGPIDMGPSTPDV